MPFILFFLAAVGFVGWNTFFNEINRQAKARKEREEEWQRRKNAARERRKSTRESES